MIDIKLIKDDPERIRTELTKRNSGLNLDQLVQFDEERRRLQQEVDSLRAEQKAANDEIAAAKGSEKQSKISAMKDVAEKVKKAEAAFTTAETEFNKLVLSLPNFSHDSVPVAPDESGNEVIKTVGEKPKLKDPKPHYEIPAIKPLIDFERGAKVSGSRFWYLKGALVHLEFALIRYTLDFYTAKGYLPMRTPDIVKEEAMYGTGFFPADANEIYQVEGGTDGEDTERKFLIGTAEVPLASYHSGETLDPANLPIKYIGFSPAYRREAGTYGKDMKGIIRGHQFDKLELFVFANPEESWNIHEQMQADAEEYWTSLAIPFQVLNIATGDLGAPNAKKYDIEGWMPGEGRYRELASNSNDTDFQARRLKIKSSGGLVHTLNNTASAINRPIIAITENYQREDGSVDMPEVLKPYLPFDRITKEG